MELLTNVADAVDAKLRYLELLQRDPVKVKEDIDGQRARISRVCDSIETDLGIIVGVDIAKGKDVTVYSHQCIGCGHQKCFIKPRIIDGLKCPKCGDALVPKRYLPK